MMRKILEQTRYIILGMLDGILLVLSLLLVALFSSMQPHQILRLSLSIGAGIFASDFLGGYYAEMAEGELKVRRMEVNMGVKKGYLKGSRVHKIQRRRAWKAALSNSLAALVGCIIPTIPILLLPSPTSIFVSLALAFSMLFLLGVYLGSISKENIIISGVKVIVVSIAIVIFNMFIGGV